MNILYWASRPKALLKKIKATFILKKTLRKFKFKEKDKFFSRSYNNYDDYIKHQKSKFIIRERYLSSNFEAKTENFYSDFKKIGDFSGKNILCLASRDGAEVKAFRKLNSYAIGIDLMYPKNSKFVHYGDFHEIPYPDGVFDYVFTNSLDHSFDINKILSEVKRVLNKDGTFLCNIVIGHAEGFKYFKEGPHESFTWSKRKDLVDKISKKYFFLEKEVKIDNRWSHFFFKIQDTN
jgi:SAM-dependent methyltransferase